MDWRRSIPGILLAPVFVAFQLISMAIGAASAQTPATPTGWWLDQTGRAGVLIAPCGNDLCGRIEWLRNPLTGAGKPKADIHNKDPDLRGSLLCGLPILGNFVPDGLDNWSGGWIYDPENGATYKSTMRLAADGTLHVRGYIGIPLLGRSEIWTRPAGTLQVCHAGN